LVSISETQEGWHEPLETIPFGTSVGVIPTHEGRVRDSLEALGPLHSKIVALVDGDSAGDAYITDLLAYHHPPYSVIQWPTGWTIEDAIAWVLEANHNWIVDLNAALGKNGANEQQARALLSNKAEDAGIKYDLIAHEAIAAMIRVNAKSLARARVLLSLLRKVAVGTTANLEGFRLDKRSTPTTSVWVFDPTWQNSSKVPQAQAKRNAL